MQKLDDHVTNPYRGTHTVFRYKRENSDVTAQFAVRRVFAGQPNEHTQMETSVERRHSTRTSGQHSSVIMTPAEARAFALSIAPELQDALDVVHAIIEQNRLVTPLPNWLVQMAEKAREATRDPS